ncbi:unnamed protein product, partial [Didymodactylos carnosus]
VKELNVRDIYRSHILTVLSSSSRWQIKSPETLLSYLLFVYDYIDPHSEQYKFDINEFKSEIQLTVRSSDNTIKFLNPKENAIYLTSIYGCECTLESIADNLPNNLQFISDDYMYEHENFLSSQAKRFVNFLKRLNMNDFFNIESKSDIYNTMDRFRTTRTNPWLHLHDDP